MQRIGYRELTYAILTILGAIIPVYYTFQFGIEHEGPMAGWTVLGILEASKDFYRTIFDGTASMQVFTDVIIGSVVFFFWMWGEGRSLGMRRLWLYPIVGYTFAVSFAIPLFLLMRERALSRARV